MTAQKMENKMEKQRFEGHCQACCKQQRLSSDNRLVHHGYQRPGDGEIHEDCDGFDRKPIELDTTFSEQILKSVNKELSAHPELTQDYMYQLYKNDNEQYHRVQMLKGIKKNLETGIKMFSNKPIIDFMEAQNHRKVEVALRPEKKKIGNWHYSKSLYRLDYKGKFTHLIEWSAGKLEEYTTDSLRAFKRDNKDIIKDFEAFIAQDPDGNKKLMKDQSDLLDMLRYLNVY